ncbi:MAG TPA: hypothetical protein VHB47_07880 [Thermoanaerobaculia bacterium]|nr:hypothetical protein [Thermoanaerobaculia bacterium]
MQPVKRFPRPRALPRGVPALAALAALLALAAFAVGACNRGAVTPGGAHDGGASQARSVPPAVSAPPVSSTAPGPGQGAGVTASREASGPAPLPSGAMGAPGSPGEPPTNELMPRSQSVRIGDAPPPPQPGVSHGESKQSDLAARERRLAERQAALEARERRLSRREESRAATAAAGSAAAAGATGGPGAGGAGRLALEDQGAAGAPGVPGAAAEPGSTASAAISAPGGVAAAAGEPEPVPAPAPGREERQPPVAVKVPAGTTFEVEFTEGLASNASTVGETFRARVVADLRLDGAIAIPAGSEVLGVVTDAVGARRIGSKARLTVEFTDLVLPSGSTLPLHASFLEEGKSRAGRDAATIGGSTAGGALLGRILGNGGRGTILGALVGAAVGTAIASKTAGEEVVIPEGSVISLKLVQPLAVDARRPAAAE